MKKMKYDAPEFELLAMVLATDIAEVSLPVEPPTEDSEGWDKEW